MSELSYEELLDHIQEQRPPDAGLSATDRGGAGGKASSAAVRDQPNLLASLSSQCLSSAIRCAWAYTRGRSTAEQLHTLASVLAAESKAGRLAAPTEALTAAAALLNKRSHLMRAVAAGHSAERIRAQLGRYGFTFAQSELVTGLLIELKEGDSDSSALGDAGCVGAGVERQIASLESLTSVFAEAAARLAKVNKQLTSAEEGVAQRPPTGNTHVGDNAEALRQRALDLDSQVGRLQRRHSMLKQRSSLAREDSNPLSPLELLHPILAGCKSADLCRFVRSCADDAGLLVWPAFRSAMSQCPGLVRTVDRLPLAQWLAKRRCFPQSKSPDMTLHVLFDTLDGDANGLVHADELVRFVHEGPAQFLAKAQREVQACIRSARAESAGLKAWLKQQEDGFRRDEARGAFDVPHEQPPRYVPFQAHSSRLSPDEHSRLWRQDVLSMITDHLSSRSVFGRPHASREEVFHTLSAHGGILPDDFAALMRRLGLGFTEEQIKVIFKEFDMDCDGSISKAEFLAMLDDFGATKRDE